MKAPLQTADIVKKRVEDPGSDEYCKYTHGMYRHAHKLFQQCTNKTFSKSCIFQVK